MSFTLLSVARVKTIHGEVRDPGELEGMAPDRSLESALARVENRLAYGMVGDVFDLAAAYAVAIAAGHCFNDANTRTAFRAMNATLAMNGVRIAWETEAVGRTLVAVAEGRKGEEALAAWLRVRAGARGG